MFVFVGIPTLVLVDEENKIISHNARFVVANDVEGKVQTSTDCLDLLTCLLDWFTAHKTCACINTQITWLPSSRRQCSKLDHFLGHLGSIPQFLFGDSYKIKYQYLIRDIRFTTDTLTVRESSHTGIYFFHLDPCISSFSVFFSCSTWRLVSLVLVLCGYYDVSWRTSWSVLSSRLPLSVYHAQPIRSFYSLDHHWL